MFTGRTDAEAETPIHWPPDVKSWPIWKERPWCWENSKEEREGDDRAWDGWMASLTQWTWVWVSSRSCWWTGRPGVLQCMGSQRVRHEGVTELNWKYYVSHHFWFIHLLIDEQRGDKLLIFNYWQKYDIACFYMLSDIINILNFSISFHTLFPMYSKTECQKASEVLEKALRKLGNWWMQGGMEVIESNVLL